MCGAWWCCSGRSRRSNGAKGVNAEILICCADQNDGDSGNAGILRCAQNDTLNAQNQTPNAQNETLNAQNQAPNAQNETLNAQNQTPNAQNETARMLSTRRS